MRMWQALVAGLALVMQPDVAAAQTRDLGAQEYALHCASCHGESGRGDGYLAQTLIIAPPDLTSITRRNGGAFPVSDVYQIIVSGRKTGSVHVTGQMPVWGAHYALDLSQSVGLLGAEDGGDADEDAAATIHARVTALINHIMTLQSPGPENGGVTAEYFISQAIETLKIAPSDLEAVIIPPKGYRATAVKLSIGLVMNGKSMPGGGDYDLQFLAERDLAGGRTQYSFAPSAQDIDRLSKIFGNAVLIQEMEVEIANDLAGVDDQQPEGSFEFSLNSPLCSLPEHEASGSRDYPSFHFRDRRNGAKFAEITVPVDASILSIGPCN